jgi:hypothetical protein
MQSLHGSANRCLKSTPHMSSHTCDIIGQQKLSFISEIIYTSSRLTLHIGILVMIGLHGDRLALYFGQSKQT